MWNWLPLARRCASDSIQSLLVRMRASPASESSEETVAGEGISCSSVGKYSFRSFESVAGMCVIADPAPIALAESAGVPLGTRNGMRASGSRRQSERMRTNSGRRS